MATASMCPAAKLGRPITGDGGNDLLLATPHLASLSEDLFFSIGSCLSVEDTISLCQVSKSISNTLLNSKNLWRTLALHVDPMIGEEIFASLSSKNKNIGEKNDQAAAASLWRRIALSRERARQQPPEEDSEEGLLSNFYEAPPPGANLKPWSSYSFILDMENVNDKRKNVSIFFEEESDVEGDVSLKIDKKHLHYFPWADDLPNTPTAHPNWFTLDTTFTVYVIDRATGKQAKLYHSGRGAQRTRYDEYRFPRMECGNYHCLKSVSGMIDGCWKEKVLSKDKGGSLSFVFCLGFGIAYLFPTGEEMLRFLEKGLVYV